MTDSDIEINKFDLIQSLRSDINSIFSDIDNKLKMLNAVHTDLVKTHIDSHYRFGLDSFHFQNRLIQLENDNMKTIFLYIDNRIYCEYYKLYRIICEYVTTDLNDKSFADKVAALYKKFPIYKDLEPTKVYDFSITNEINSSINQIILELQNYNLLKKSELENEQKKASSGINIHNLIHEQVYRISLLEEKINMFMRYLDTFHTHHTNYLNRLIIKLKLMNQIVNEDISLKQNFSFQTKPKIPNDQVSALTHIQLGSSPRENMIIASQHVMEYDYDEPAKPEMLYKSNIIIDNVTANV
jgi:hypothetical protein